MGGWVNRLGKYEASQMDYYYDSIKGEGQTLEYYESQTVDVKFKNLETKEEKTIQVPLIQLHDFVKSDDGTYSLSSSNENKSLRILLWGRLQKNNIVVKSAFKLNLHLDREYWNICPDYYLNSEPLNDDIKISTTKQEFEIKSLKTLDWLASHGFIYG